MLVRFCGSNSRRRARADDDIESKSGSSHTSSAENDHAVLPMSWGVASLACILLLAAAARAAIRVPCENYKAANDHTVLPISCGKNSASGGIAAEEIAEISGWSHPANLANDHAVLAMSCGLKEDLLAIAEEDIASRSGLSGTASRDKAHTVLERS